MYTKPLSSSQESQVGYTPEFHPKDMGSSTSQAQGNS